MKWKLQWRSPKLEYYWQHNFVYQVYKKGILQKYFTNQERDVCSICSSDFSFFVEEKSIAEMKEDVLDFFLNQSRFDAWKKDVESLSIKVKKISWEIRDNSISDSIKNIKFLEKYFHFSVGLHFVTQPHLVNHLQDEISMLDLSQYNLLKELPTVLVEQKEWIDLLHENRQEDFNPHIVLEHLHKWKYITAGDSQKPMSLKYLSKRWNNDIRDINRLFDQTERYLSNGDQEISGENDYEKQIIEVLSEISFLRFKTKEIWMKLWYLLEKNMGKLGELLGIDEIFSYTVEEIENFDFSKLNRDSYLFLKHAEDYSLYYNGLEEQKIEEIIKSKDFSKMNELIGSVGYAGRTIGKAVVVDWDDDIEDKISKIDSNSILIVPQTTPNLVGAIQKCKGIVCDEGGIAGHASIISRELKKICILNVKYGTKVFKDGDIVKIDTFANKVSKEVVV